MSEHRAWFAGRRRDPADVILSVMTQAPAFEIDVAMSPEAERRWATAGLWCLAVTVGLIAALLVLGRLATLNAEEAAGTALVAEVTLGVVTLAAISRAAGSARVFARGVGLLRSSWDDAVLGWWRGFWWQLFALIGFGIVVGLADPHAWREASNLRGVHGAPVADIAVFAVAAVVLAPLVEECQFRALLLWSAASRYGFRGAMLGTSLVFGLLHGWQVRPVVGVTVLVARMVVFGVVQCLLVRRNRSLLPNVLVHATFNLLAIVFAAM